MKVVNWPHKFGKFGKSVRSLESVARVKWIWGRHIFRCADVSPSDKQTEVWWRTFSYSTEFSLSELLTSVSLSFRANFLRKKCLKYPELQQDYIPRQKSSNNNKKKVTIRFLYILGQITEAPHAEIPPLFPWITYTEHEFSSRQLS
jgi:hypothetical protein